MLSSRVGLWYQRSLQPQGRKRTATKKISSPWKQLTWMLLVSFILFVITTPNPCINMENICTNPARSIILGSELMQFQKEELVSQDSPVKMNDKQFPLAVRMTPRKATTNHIVCARLSFIPLRILSQSAEKMGEVELRVIAIGRGRQNWHQAKASPWNTMIEFLTICHLKLLGEGKVRSISLALARGQVMAMRAIPLKKAVVLGWNLCQLEQMKPREKRMGPDIINRMAMCSLFRHRILSFYYIVAIASAALLLYQIIYDHSQWSSNIIQFKNNNAHALEKFSKLIGCEKQIQLIILIDNCGTEFLNIS